MLYHYRPQCASERQPLSFSQSSYMPLKRQMGVKVNKQIEILAPAGSYESMRAAMNAGCDAVYIGGGSFGARAYANNLDEETLLRAIDEAHIRDKKLYLTVNTLIKEEELADRLYRFLESFYREGLDAVIVQDPGVMHFIHRNFPLLPIHASTQTTVTMSQGAGLFKDSGVTRLVTARELSLKEIRDIRDNTDLELETFVHGALCYCYSGQCLMSSMIGGRSGNRGRCAQPCRMPYQFYSEGRKVSAGNEKYLLSPKDINTTALIPELVEAGINSFKIEGRMKRPEYSAGVAYMYRKCTDRYLEYGRERYQEYLRSPEYETDRIALMDLYNRGGFSEGYGRTYHGKPMMSLLRPNHSGVLVGEVVGMKGSQAVILVKEKVNAQDILEIRGRDEEPGYEFTLKTSKEKGETFIANTGSPPGGRDKKKSGRKVIDPGAPVYRTRNNELLNRLASEYMEQDARRGIRGVLTARIGERLSLTLRDKDFTASACQDIVQAAQKQPMTREKLKGPIEKLGDTLFFLEDLEIHADEGSFVPVAWLNEIRRDALRKLQEAIIGYYRRDEGKIIPTVNKEAISKESETEKPLPGICVTVRNGEQFQAVVKTGEVTSIYADCEGFLFPELLRMAEKAAIAGKSFYPVLPHICRRPVYQQLEKDIGLLWREPAVTGFVAKNYEEIFLLQSLRYKEPEQKEIILNHNMYVFNREARAFWHTKGIRHFTAPVELNQKELTALGIIDCDILVYGYLPLMVSAQCLHESTEGCLRCKAGEHRIEYLVDRMGSKFYVQTNCNGCYNVILNGQCLSLLKYSKEINVLQPRNLRLDFTLEKGEEVSQVLSSFIRTYRGGQPAELDIDNLTTGHFKRGVE